MNIQARIEELYKDLAAALTVATGEEWKRQYHAEKLSQRVVAPDELTLTLHKLHPDRIQISVDFGDAYQFADRTALRSITVRADRSSMEFAREITRRLLPEARPAWQQACEALRQHGQREAQRAVWLQEMIAAGCVGSWQEWQVFNRPGGAYFHARVEQYGVYFERIGSVSVDAAKKIVAILNDPASK